MDINKILIEASVETNSHCVNKKIKANILEEEKMRKLGFTDFSKDRWHFSRLIEFPNEKRYKNFEVCFGLSIPKDGSEIRIDVLDEAFCQPYDYQNMIIQSRNNGTQPNKTALIVFEQVEQWMKFLADNGIIEGHIYGEYI